MNKIKLEWAAAVMVSTLHIEHARAFYGSVILELLQVSRSFHKHNTCQLDREFLDVELFCENVFVVLVV